MVNDYQVPIPILTSCTIHAFLFLWPKTSSWISFQIVVWIIRKTKNQYTLSPHRAYIYYCTETNPPTTMEKLKWKTQEAKYLFPGPHEPQSNLGSRICSSNNISCSPSDRPLLKNMGVGNYSNKAIYVTPHITVDKVDYSPLPTLC